MERAKRLAAGRPQARTVRREVASAVRDAYEASVLVIEADPEVQVQMARALRRSGLRVVGTSSGDGALALISEWEVDLILVSEDLPGRTGIEVTRLLHEASPRTKILLLTVTSEAEVWEAARAAGAVDCLSKPLELHRLSRWLRPTTSTTIPRDEAPAVAE
jgi:CheY-like chemotaxis protein